MNLNNQASVTVTLADALLASDVVYAYQEMTKDKQRKKRYDQVVAGWRDEVILISLQENKKNLGEKLIKMEFARIGKGYVGLGIDKVDSKLVDPTQPVTIDMYGNSSISYLDDSMMPDMSPRNDIFSVVFVKHAASAVNAQDIREAVAGDAERRRAAFKQKYGYSDEQLEELKKDFTEAFGE